MPLLNVILQVTHTPAGHWGSFKPSAEVNAIDQETAALSERLNNMFQLVMGAINVNDAHISRVQGERSTVLTILASIYLPLSLVASIFGMNIEEINQTGWDWRPVLATLAVIIVVTAMFLGIYYAFRALRRNGVFSGRMRIFRHAKGPRPAMPSKDVVDLV
jgi:hypothetical protein